LNEDIQAVVPYVYINVNGLEGVTDKEVYLNAEVYIDGNNKFMNDLFCI
jgi:hypothetical protein